MDIIYLYTLVTTVAATAFVVVVVFFCLSAVAQSYSVCIHFIASKCLKITLEMNLCSFLFNLKQKSSSGSSSTHRHCHCCQTFKDEWNWVSKCEAERAEWALLNIMNIFLLSFLRQFYCDMPLIFVLVNLTSCRLAGLGGDGGFYVCLSVVCRWRYCSLFAAASYFIAVCYLFGIVISHFIRNLICSSFHFIVILLCVI